MTPGEYLTTAYGPPWGGIQGAGITTSGGLAIGGGAPRWYMIAVDPQLIAHGTLVDVWPNPFGWNGPFLAADTGGAIQGRRIDFYDWRGRLAQYRWGQRQAQATPRRGASTAPSRDRRHRLRARTPAREHRLAARCRACADASPSRRWPTRPAGPSVRS